LEEFDHTDRRAVVQVRKLLASTVVSGAVVWMVAGPAAASSGSACVYTKAQAGGILGSPVSHTSASSVAAAHEKLCTYTTNAGAAAISITESPASGYPTASLLKMMIKGASVTTLKGIGSAAELARSKTQGLVELYFVVGKNYYAVTLSDGRAKVSSKQISTLESTSSTAAKKL
jgi:hypothetical protein